MDIVLFDFDGTIADSGPTILAAAAQTLEAMGYSLPDTDRMRRFVGPPIAQGIIDVLRVPEPAAAEFLQQYRARYLTTMLGAPLYDGIPELLAALTSEGWTLATASSKREDLVSKIIDAHDLGDYFTAIGGADLAETRASKEAVVGHTLNLLGASADTDRIIMVGDRHHDIEGAASHGIRTIFVTWGYGTVEEADDALAVVHSTAELHDALAELRRQPIR